MRRYRHMLLVIVLLGVGAYAAWSKMPAEAERASPVVTPVYPPGTVVLGAATGEPLVDLPLVLPNPIFSSEPVVIPDNVRIDRRRLGKSRGGVVAPPGLRNLAIDRSVTSSDKFPIIGDLELITDSDKEPRDGHIHMVELAPGPQWVQIDLGDRYELWAILVWHNDVDPRIYRDVVVQVSDDPRFRTGVTTVFNNDHDNSSGLGAGVDFEYRESFEGELIDAGGVHGRYVRLWSHGSTADDANHYGEVEVWGRPPPPGMIERWADAVAGWLRWW